MPSLREVKSSALLVVHILLPPNLLYALKCYRGTCTSFLAHTLLEAKTSKSGLVKRGLST